MNNDILTPEEHRRSVRRLWQECFGDSDEFCDLYFSRVYSPEVDYSVVQDGRVVSALQSLPYSMLCAGREVRIEYLSGVCTAPAYRTRGLAGGLVERTVGDMLRRGCVFGFLIPSGADVLPFYARYGYHPALMRAALPATPPPAEADTPYSLVRTTDMSDEFYALFAARQQARRGFALFHSREQFATVAADWLKGGNAILGATLGGRLVSYAFVRPDESTHTLFIYDAPTTPCPAFDFLLRQAHIIYNAYALRTYVVNPDTAHDLTGAAHVFTDTAHDLDDAANVFACARIIDAEAALAIHAALHPDCRLRIRLTGDALLPDNNGGYILADGLCRRAAADDGDFTPVDLRSLTHLIFHNTPASFNFLLE